MENERGEEEEEEFITSGNWRGKHGRRPFQSSHSVLGAPHRQWSTSAETCEGRGYHYRALHGGRARACKRHGSAARKLHLQGLVGTCGRWRRRPAGGGGVQWLPFTTTAVALRRWQLERHRTLARGVCESDMCSDCTFAQRGVFIKLPPTLM